MRKILTFVTLFYVLATWSQIDLKYRTLSTDEGLPSNFVINMVQDPQGYIWMATADGLCRYDGYSFDVIRHTATGNDSLLLSNRLRELHMNPNGLLFIRIQGERYSCYDTHRRQFVEFISGDNNRNYCDCIFTPEGDTWLWYPTTGCLQVTYHDGVIESHEYSKENGSLTSNNVLFIESDSYHRVWIGTDNGLYVKSGGKLTLKSRGKVFNSAVEKDGVMYFATSAGMLYHVGKDGLLVQDVSSLSEKGHQIKGLVPLNDKIVILTESTTFCYDLTSHQVITYHTQMPGGIVYRDNKNNYYVGDNTVNIHYFDQARKEIYSFHALDSKLLSKRGIRPYQVLTDDEGAIWISTIGNGLFVYDPETRTQTHYSPRNAGYSPIVTDYLYGLMLDRSGQMWISQENMGISVVTTMPRGVRRYFATQSVTPDYNNLFRSVRKTADGRVWAGNFMGATYQLDGQNLKKVNLCEGDDMLAMCIDSQGHQWVGTRKTGVIVDGRVYRNHAEDTLSLASGKVFDILCDNRHRVWLTVNMGALCLALPQPDGSYKFRRFLNDRMLMRNVTKLHQSHSGDIFVGCGDGLVVFNPDQLIRNPKAFHHYHSDNSNLGYFEIRDIFEDADGSIWLASAGGGLYRIKNPSEIGHLDFEQWTTEQGLADNTANSIIADQYGKLWIGTNFGLSRLDPKTMQFATFYLSSDKLGDVYSENSACLLDDGTIVMGTNNGVVCFNSKDILAPRQVNSQLVVTNLLVNGNPYDDYQLEDKIVLGHRQNSLTFRFSDLMFAFPHNTEYQYFLEGADRQWSQPTRQNEAVYKDLPPGTYVFHVRKLGTEDEVTLRVVIRQPWWNTWWAWLLYLAIIGAVAWYIIRLLMITYSMRNRIKMDKEISDFKQRFFMDVSHEFRTPLTLIHGSMERMCKAGDLPANLRQPMSNMSRSTGRMMRLVNQLLEADKYEQGKLRIKLQETDVIKFLRDITMSFSDLAYNRQMNLQYVPFAQHFSMYIDQGCVDKIVYNLLSNAFKYTPRKGDVTVRVKRKDGRIIIRVEDSGVGVPPERQAQLFTRFMQTNLAADSMGIGLNFTQKLVEAHHGEIHYEDNPSGGSVFVVSLPESVESYQPEDLMVPAGFSDDKAEEEVVMMQSYKELAAEPLNDRTVLVVEDDEDVREYICGEVSAYFKVCSVQNGAEALELLQGDTVVDLVLSDIKMPIMDGIQLLKKVRADDALFDIPFILLTAMGSIEKQLQGVQFGADAYIPKPFSPALLISKCISLIKQRDRLKIAYSQVGSDNNEVKGGTTAAPLIMSERDRKFREIVDIKIASNIDNPDFVVDDLAQVTGYGRSQFFSKMMEVTGKTPKEYIRMKRMMKAAELLRSGEMVTVAEVAYKVGFTDSLYFSRCFKQYFGMTPSKYQKG